MSNVTHTQSKLWLYALAAFILFVQPAMAADCITDVVALAADNEAHPGLDLKIVERFAGDEAVKLRDAIALDPDPDDEILVFGTAVYPDMVRIVYITKGCLTGQHMMPRSILEITKGQAFGHKANY